MSGHQIQKYKERFTFRFLYWGIFNKQKFANPIDYRIVACRIFDVNFEILSCVVMGICLNKFFSYLKTPFLDLAFEGKKISAMGIKRIGVVGVVGYGAYRSVKSLVQTPYLFDIAMKYKEDFAKDELISPNCEAIFKKYLIRE